MPFSYLINVSQSTDRLARNYFAVVCISNNYYYCKQGLFPLEKAWERRSHTAQKNILFSIVIYAADPKNYYSVTIPLFERSHISFFSK